MEILAAEPADENAVQRDRDRLNELTAESAHVLIVLRPSATEALAERAERGARAAPARFAVWVKTAEVLAPREAEWFGDDASAAAVVLRGAAPVVLLDPTSPQFLINRALLKAEALVLP